MKWNRTATIILVALYGIVIAHFVYSNYVQVIGPNVSIGTQRDQCGSLADCVHSCTLSAPLDRVVYDEKGTNPVQYKNKGFPFRVHWLDKNWCPNVDIIRTINSAKYLNFMYIGAITVVFGMVGLLYGNSLKDRKS